MTLSGNQAQANAVGREADLRFVAAPEVEALRLSCLSKATLRIIGVGVDTDPNYFQTGYKAFPAKETLEFEGR